MTNVSTTNERCTATEQTNVTSHGLSIWAAVPHKVRLRRLRPVRKHQGHLRDIPEVKRRRLRPRWHHHSMSREREVSVRSFVFGLRAEVTRVLAVVVRRWSERGIRGYLLTALIAATIVVLWWADHTTGRSIVAMCCGERVDQSLGISVLRLPGSMFAPAALLPVWGSVLQVLLAFGIGEAVVGARRTLTVAAFAHSLGTLAGRYFVWYAPAALGGLPTSWRYALDTGPSAATCGLAVYLALVLGSPRLGSIIFLAVVVALALHPDLAGREHLVALAVGAAAAGIHLLRLRRAAGRLVAVSTIATANAESHA